MVRLIKAEGVPMTGTPEAVRWSKVLFYEFSARAALRAPGEYARAQWCVGSRKILSLNVGGPMRFHVGTFICDGPHDEEDRGRLHEPER